MKFPLDENLGIKVQKFILDFGHKCVRASSVLERGASGSSSAPACQPTQSSLKKVGGCLCANLQVEGLPSGSYQEKRISPS